MHWVKLDTDGSFRVSSKSTSCGGVLQDDFARWLAGFAANLGSSSSPLAELWGVFYGLHFAEQRGFRKLSLEVDSKVVLDLLLHDIPADHPYFGFIAISKALIVSGWEFKMSHIYREANLVADAMANLGPFI